MVGEPLHNIWFETEVTVGVGFTVIVKVLGVPGQPLAVGVTVIVATTGLVPLLVAVKEEIFPLPLAPKPMDGVLFTHA